MHHLGVIFRWESTGALRHTRDLCFVLTHDRCCWRVFNLQCLWGRKTMSSVAPQRRADSNSSHSCLWKIYFSQHFWRFTLRGLIYISCTIRLLSEYQHLIKHANQLSYARLHFPSVNLRQGYCSCRDVRCSDPWTIPSFKKASSAICESNASRFLQPPSSFS